MSLILRVLQTDLGYGLSFLGTMFIVALSCHLVERCTRDKTHGGGL